jgi:5'-nucleotidase
LGFEKETDMRTKRCPVTITALAFLLAAALQCIGVEQSRPRILLSNDDGIDAPGLLALFEALQKVGTVTVAAPVNDQSGVSHGMTTQKLIPVRESVRNGARWLAIEATPASCVRLALESFLPERPDIVVSGINRGENVGLVTFYSATVAAAREAAFLKIPAISVNLKSSQDMDYRAAADFTAALVREVGRAGLEKGLLVNVNVPALPRDKIKGVLVTRQDVRATMEFFEKKDTRDGKTLYWPSYKALDAGPEGTDTWAVRNGYIAVTPLSLDQTDAAALKKLAGLEKLAWK